MLGINRISTCFLLANLWLALLALESVNFILQLLDGFSLRGIGLD